MISDFLVVALKEGPVVPIGALTLAWELEAAGFFLYEQDGVLRVSRRDDTPVGEALTVEHRAAITKWKLHLLAILAYDPEPKKRDRGRLTQKTRQQMHACPAP